MRSHFFAAEGPWTRRVEVVDRIVQVIDYLFGILYALLLIRFVLALLDARMSAGFVRFINRVTEPFYAPFSGIVATSSSEGVRIVWSLIVAIVVYAIVHAAIRGLFAILARE